MQKTATKPLKQKNKTTGILNALRQRRSYYDLEKSIPLSDDQLIALIDDVTELVPDSLNMKSARVVIALGEQHDKLWDTIYDVFDGKVKREKIDTFKAGYGTILYFYDADLVHRMSDKYPFARDKFPVWSQQANAMLQFSVWNALRERGIGASLQHYNPVIDDAVKALFDLPGHWTLNAQMPFGAIGSEPAPKEKEDIRQRVLIRR